ncbi:MAG: Dabb family protein [Kiritimatiellae bacterium]|nr:Dabb family protein [Kiritimatiellia bacterium]
MVKHVILWQLKDDVADKAAVKAGIKAGLEGLKGVVPGLLEVVVRTEGLASSNADVMLDTTLESEEALKGYAVHPAHVQVANEKVRPFTKTRLCLDYRI